MERVSKKRSRGVATLEVKREEDKEELEEEEDLILKLKPAKKDLKDPLQLLEEACSAEEEDHVLETLLQLEDSVYSRVLPSLDEALTLIKRIWKSRQNNIEICGVLVNTLCRLLPLVTCLSRDQQHQIVSLIEHRKILIN